MIYIKDIPELNNISQVWIKNRITAETYNAWKMKQPR